jgi:hypothetical protein
MNRYQMLGGCIFRYEQDAYSGAVTELQNLLASDKREKRMAFIHTGMGARCVLICFDMEQLPSDALSFRFIPPDQST